MSSGQEKITQAIYTGYSYPKSYIQSPEATGIYYAIKIHITNTPPNE